MPDVGLQGSPVVPPSARRAPLIPVRPAHLHAAALALQLGLSATLGLGHQRRHCGVAGVQRGAVLADGGATGRQLRRGATIRVSAAATNNTITGPELALPRNRITQFSNGNSTERAERLTSRSSWVTWSRRSSSCAVSRSCWSRRPLHSLCRERASSWAGAHSSSQHTSTSAGFTTGYVSAPGKK